MLNLTIPERKEYTIYIKEIEISVIIPERKEYTVYLKLEQD